MCQNPEPEKFHRGFTFPSFGGQDFIGVYKSQEAVQPQGG